MFCYLVISGLCVVLFRCVCVCACQLVEVCSSLPPQSVRRVALVAFNSAAHNKPVLIADLLDSLLPILYRETKVRVSGTHTHRHAHLLAHTHSQTLTNTHTLSWLLLCSQLR